MQVASLDLDQTFEITAILRDGELRCHMLEMNTMHGKHCIITASYINNAFQCSLFVKMATWDTYRNQGEMEFY